MFSIFGSFSFSLTHPFSFSLSLSLNHFFLLSTFSRTSLFTYRLPFPPPFHLSFFSYWFSLCERTEIDFSPVFCTGISPFHKLHANRYNANIHTHKKNTHERERLKTMKQSPHIEVEKAVESIIFISIIFLVKSLFLGRHVFVVLFKRRIFMVSCLFSFKCQCLSALVTCMHIYYI